MKPRPPHHLAWPPGAALPRAAPLLAAVASLLLGACASQRDRFYVLSAMPEAAHQPRPAITTQLALGVTLPEEVDRREMVLGAQGDQVVILEHERWAASLSDLIAETLGLDIERRRPDLLAVDRPLDRSNARVRIKVDIVRLSARAPGNVTLEAHWRIVNPQSKGDEVGAQTFTAPVESADYAAVARALSAAVSSLADRLVAKLPTG